MKENEEKKIVLNLQHVEVELDIDRMTTMDLSRAVGNTVHRYAGDIGLDDKARELYHNGEAEVTESVLNQMRAIVAQSDFALYVKTAVARHIEKCLTL